MCYRHISKCHASLIEVHPEGEIIGIIDVDQSKTEILSNAYNSWVNWLVLRVQGRYGNTPRIAIQGFR